MTLKEILGLDNEILTYAVAFLIVCGAIFTAGRYSAPLPPKDVVCRVEIRTITARDDEIARLKNRVVLSRAQLNECENSCDNRLRKLADRKDVQIDKLVADALKIQKQRFLKFKCSRCKSQGLCK